MSAVVHHKTPELCYTPSVQTIHFDIMTELHPTLRDSNKNCILLNTLWLRTPFQHIFGCRIKYVGLSSKVYSISTIENESLIKKCKGISRDVVKQNIHKQDYINCVYNQSFKILLEQRNIISKKHCLYTELVNKTALTSKDRKRKMLENDKVYTRALGHYIKIKSLN